MKFRLIIFALLFSIISNAQIVQNSITTVTSPSIYAMFTSAISKDNKYVGGVDHYKAYIFDLKTGLLIQEITLPHGFTEAIECWFSEDSKIFYVSHSNEYNPKNQTLEIDLNSFPFGSRIINLKEKKYKYKSKKDEINKLLFSNYFFEVKSKDKKKKIIYKQDKTETNYKSLEVLLVIDTDTINLGFDENCCVYFNEESTIVFANNYIIDLINYRMISELKVLYEGGGGGVASFYENKNIYSVVGGILIQKGKGFKYLPNIESNGATYIVSPDSDSTLISIFTNGSDSYVQRINIENKIITNLFMIESSLDNIAKLAPNKDAIIIESNLNNNGYHQYIYELKTGNLVIKVPDDLLLNFDSSDGIIGSPKAFYSVYDELYKNYIRTDIHTGSLDTNYNFYLSRKKHIQFFNFSTNGQFLFYIQADLNYKLTQYIVDLENNKIVHSQPLKLPFYLNFFDISSSGEYAYICSVFETRIVSLVTGETIKKLDIGDVKSKPTFTTDSKTIIFQTSSTNYMFWDIKKEKELYTLILTGGNSKIYTAPEGYFMSDLASIDFVHFCVGGKVYPFEQFDLKYNRPDIILEQFDYVDSSLVYAYNQAYQKRLKKMGFTEDMLKEDFHLPEIKIENFESLPTIVDKNNIDLKLMIKDTKYELDRINVWINDVAIYGVNGISLRDKNIQDYSTTLSVNLAKGKNKVQVSVLNQAGAESYKETIEVECTAGKDKPDLYLITIGESKFEQSNYNLAYAAKDANDMAALFNKSKAYENVYTKILVNEQVIKENIFALSSFLEQADINDQIMIFIAGHGILDANLDYYFATYDMNFTNPSDKGIAYGDLESLLDGVKPLKKTLIIDACHSGEIDKDEVELAQNNNLEEGDIQFRAVGNTVTPKLGIQNTSELTKLLFTDLRKGTGATVISSAGGMEFAMESADWNNGLFTFCLLKGITSGEADLNHDGEIWLSELQEYVQEQVTLLSNGKQQPTSRIENQVVDFRVW